MDKNKLDLTKHIVASIQTFIAGLCVWMAVTLQSSSVQIAQAMVKITSLEQEVILLRQQAIDQYTDKDASRDLALIHTQINALDSRISKMENKNVKVQ